jgi:V-type H+-transporting ATPase proteolipid subunit
MIGVLILFHLSFFPKFAAGLCCGISCLAAGGTIGMIGEAGVQGFGLRAEGGRKWFWEEGVGVSEVIGDSELAAGNSVEAANKLYVGMLIMLIFSEALAL